jgi:hypothetical protein
MSIVLIIGNGELLMDDRGSYVLLYLVEEALYCGVRFYTSFG